MSDRRSASQEQVSAALATAMREHWAHLLALLVAEFRRLELAEDALAEAYATAARTWAHQGVPHTPAAWLRTASRRRAIDALRREDAAKRTEPLLAVEADLRQRIATLGEDETHIPDERLRLIFMCAHPALDAAAQAALMLRFVAGLPTAQIAGVFLVPVPTMAARLTRAKRRIAASGHRFELPAAESLPDRLDVVLATLYLLFTAGYSPATGEQLLDVEVSAEAIHLTRVLETLLPGHPAVRALLALMVLHHARRDARTDTEGRLVPLDEQDRDLWHAEELDEGLRLLDSLPGEVAGLAAELRLQGLIAAEHARAARAEDTDWAAIHAHYTRLEELTGSPMIRLARSVALIQARGPRAGLALLDRSAADLERHHRFHAARGDALARLGETTDAAAAFDTAIAMCANAAERAHLIRRRGALLSGRADEGLR